MSFLLNKHINTISYIHQQKACRAGQHFHKVPCIAMHCRVTEWMTYVCKFENNLKNLSRKLLTRNSSGVMAVTLRYFTEFGKPDLTWLDLIRTEGFPWDDLRKILPGCQQMASVPNGVETSPKISIAWVGRMNVTDRQTDDRQTDGWWHIANVNVSSPSLKTVQTMAHFGNPLAEPLDPAADQSGPQFENRCFIISSCREDSCQVSTTAGDERMTGFCVASTR